MDTAQIEGEAQNLAAKVTPEKVARLVHELEPQQHFANRGTVAIDQIVDRLLVEAGYDLAERARFEVSLKQAILHAAKQLPDMEFVDGG